MAAKLSILSQMLSNDMSKKTILIFAAQSDKKLISKILPILENVRVKKVFLVRKIPLNYVHPKLIQCNCPNAIRKSIVLCELYRLVNSIVIARRNKIDIFIGIHLILHGSMAVLLARIFNKKSIILFIENPKKYGKSFWFTILLKQAFRIGVRGKNSSKYLHSIGVPTIKLFIPPNVFEIPTTAIDLINTDQNKIYDLIYIGGFDRVKNLDLWIKVFSEVKQKIGHLKGVMLGNGPEFERIQQVIKNYHLESDIDLTGYSDDIYSYLKKSRILLITSKSEGLPMVGIESMSAGVPTVMPDVGDISDLIDHQVNGFLVPSDKFSDYSKAIIDILSDNKLYATLSSNAINKIKNLSEKSSVDKLVQLWDQVLL